MTNNRVITCIFPHTSVIAQEALAADFFDAHKLVALDSDLNPLEVYLQMVNKTPHWVNRLLRLRNKIMQHVGLKDVGSLGRLKLADYDDIENLVGRKLDIFTIDVWKSDEMILVLNDKHLDIKLSILIQREGDQRNVIVSTIVKFNNFLGNLYMIAITPFHKKIVKRLLHNVR